MSNDCQTLAEKLALFDEETRSAVLEPMLALAENSEEIRKRTEESKARFFREAKERGLTDETFLEETWKLMAEAAMSELKFNLNSRAKVIRKLQSFGMPSNDNATKTEEETPFARTLGLLLNGIAKYYRGVPGQALQILHVDETSSLSHTKRFKVYQKACSKKGNKRWLVCACFEPEFGLIRVTEFDLELRILKDGSTKMTGPTAHAAMMKIFPNGVLVPKNEEEPGKR